ncbi:MAG: hydantoinase/oxoprolinase family protein, partial [Acidimicrobiales bacterium]
GRLDQSGKELAPLGPVPAVPPGVDAVAVCLLHADLNPDHERRVAAALAAGAAEVVCSVDVSPECRDYERTVTTVVDAYLRRPCAPYLAALAALAPEVLVMTSAGGLIPLAEAAARPVALLLSGPAGGVRAAAAAAATVGFADCVTFDMGGTSTDVCLVRGGQPEPAAERRVAGLPIRMPALDVHTVGAGGGSLAAMDGGGALTVGPRSAGADPGPACYGRGGGLPTVTDADIVAGHLPGGMELPGLGRLDAGAAQRALEAGSVSAEGVIAVVDASMARAVRVVSVQRGVDPAPLALVAFGGAGPLHACGVADQLGMATVVVPPRAGVLSAVGLLGAPRRADLVRSWGSCFSVPPGTAGVDDAARQLGAEATARLGPDAVAARVDVGFDCRYRGQGYELTVPSVGDFEAEHENRNGFRLPDTPVEVVALRATAWRRSPVDIGALPRPDRRGPVTGPAVIAESDCTVWVPDGWKARVHPSGSWVITKGE